MMKRFSIILIAAACAMIVLAGCHITSTRESIPAVHPEELDPVRADCLECHEDVSTGALKPYETFRHTIVFVRQHGRQYAPQKQNLCTACHTPSFCQTCHASKDELKPSVKLGNRPDRALYHRGDYLVQHRLEGRVDPGRCYRCHGRRDTGTCSSCHN